MRFVIKELSRHKWRTIAGIVGYAIVSLFILLILSVSKANEKDSFGILKGTGTHFIVYIPNNTSCCVNCDSNGGNTGGSLFAEGVFTLMLNSDLLDSIKKIDGIRDAAPYLLYKLYDEKLKTEIALGGIDTLSDATKNNVCAATNLTAGKFFTGKTNEIVAEEAFAKAHGLSVNDTLNIYGEKLILTGIINSGIKPGKADIYAPIENVRTILKDKLKCISSGFDMNIVLVEVNDARIQNRVIDEVKKKMSYLTVSTYNCYKPAATVMKLFEKTGRVLSVIIFMFLILFATKTQLTSLMERYREIGILKSLGWSDFRLGKQIIITSVIQSIIGVTIGCLAGILIISLINNYNIVSFDAVKLQFPMGGIPVLIVLSLAGGIIAGIFPVIRLHRRSAGDMINNYL